MGSGPERDIGQGIGGHKEESGNRALISLLMDPDVRDHVDLVITVRNGVYEVWAARGCVRFQRIQGKGGPSYEVVEVVGENPVARQDPFAIATIEEELQAARASGCATDDPNLAYIEPNWLSYPWAYERIAQLFDSPNAPDLVLSPKCYAFGLQPGQHGALDCVQSRAPLVLRGPGVRSGRFAVAARHVDIAPTICHLMGFPYVDGCDASGQTSTERNELPDVYLRRQDGRVLHELLDPAAERRPQRAYLVLFDGLSHSELMYLLESNNPAVENLRRLVDSGALLTGGSTVNFPSITWPSHSTILTGAWCGHHDVINPSYYLRSEKMSVAPQAEALMTERFLGPEVETLYEVFARVSGGAAVTAAIHEPQGRGAGHAPLEQRLLTPKDRLKALTPELLAEIDRRHADAGKQNVVREAQLDARGVAQVLTLFDATDDAIPRFVAHEFAMTDGAGHDYGPHGEGLRAAVAETDRRLGRVLRMLDAKGYFESTLFVFTSDHGMAAQNTSLAANPARHLERRGMKVITHEPMIWLQDLGVNVVVAGDRRTARVEVFDPDGGEATERWPIEGAEVSVRTATEAAETLARGKTNTLGAFGFGIPADLPPASIVLSVRHGKFNSRHLRLDGSSISIDPRDVLYRTDRRSEASSRAD